METEKWLIDANALIEEINQQRRTSRTSFPRRSYVVGDVLASIYNAPAVDAVEVVHGRWIEHLHLEVGGECSVCGWQFQWFENGEAHYCPHCGAKMDLQNITHQSQ